MFSARGSAVLLAVLVAGLVGPAGLAQEESQVTITQVLSDGVDEATVSIQPRARTVEVHLLTEMTLAPPTVELKLLDENSNPVTLALKTVGLDGTGNPAYLGYFIPSMAPHLSDLSDSYVGIELSIPWAKGAPSILRPLDALNPFSSFFRFRPLGW
jgi:hypothetical protein